MTDLIIRGDEAWLPDEWAAEQERRDRRNAAIRERRRTDPAYRERHNAWQRGWYAKNRDKRRAYNRDWMRRKRAQRVELRHPERGSLHSLRCTNAPCDCRTIYGVAA